MDETGVKIIHRKFRLQVKPCLLLLAFCYWLFFHTDLPPVFFMTYKWKSLLLAILVVLLLPTSFSASANNTVNYKFNFGENIETLEQKIQVACSHFDCNSDQLIRVMQCESKGQNISNPSGIHSGIFQYTRGTWANFSQKSGIPNADIWDTDAQIYTTTWAFSNGLKSHWSCK